MQDTVRLRVADIPGLIDGAHRNRGLGHEFLRHVTRTRALMFVVDAAGSEGRNPVEDLQSLKEELRLYDEDLVERPTFVVANKMDLPGGRMSRTEMMPRAASFWCLPSLPTNLEEEPLFTNYCIIQSVICLHARESNGFLGVILANSDEAA